MIMYFSSLIVSVVAASSVLVAASPAELWPRSDLRGFDISQPQSAAFWSCAHNAGYGKAVIRIYQQACGSVSKGFFHCYQRLLMSREGRSNRQEFPILVQSCTNRRLHQYRCVHVSLWVICSILFLNIFQFDTVAYRSQRHYWCVPGTVRSSSFFFRKAVAHQTAGHSTNRCGLQSHQYSTQRTHGLPCG